MRPQRYIGKPGDRYGSRTVIRQLAERQFKHIIVEVRCDCGDIGSVELFKLRRGESHACHSCGTRNNRADDLPLGTRVNAWTLIEVTFPKSEYMWRCDCGTTRKTDPSQIKNSKECMQCRRRKDEAKRARGPKKPWAGRSNCHDAELRKEAIRQLLEQGIAGSEVARRCGCTRQYVSMVKKHSLGR